ncbi:hypothetical protein CL3_06180 [butyrate-producing bacterium SM4/1]|nr:hypothetical protein CL3_06180 [butyrate-producing bacterium SM4/1]
MKNESRKAGSRRRINCSQKEAELAMGQYKSIREFSQLFWIPWE